MLRRIILGCLCIVGSAPSAMAQNQSLSIEDIQLYYNEYANIFNNTTIDLPKLETFLATRYMPAAVMTTAYTDNITKERRFYSHNAQEAAQSVLVTAAKMTDMRSKIEFKFLEIADDGQTATIRYLMHYHGNIRTQNTSGRTIDLPYKSIAGCAEWLDISNNPIRVKLSDCNVRTNFSHKVKD